MTTVTPVTLRSTSGSVSWSLRVEISPGVWIDVEISQYTDGYSYIYINGGLARWRQGHFHVGEFSEYLRQTVNELYNKGRSTSNLSVQ